jgi:uncharacterized membrane protein YcaP (DUF421 family)
MQEILGVIESVFGFGLNQDRLNAGQMMARAVLVFTAALTVVRLANKRFLGRSTAFDTVLGLMLGSVLSRGITGNAPILPAVAGAATLVALHWILAAVTFHSHRVGNLAKGRPQKLLEDGRIDWNEMHKSHITEHDLIEQLRTHGKITDFEEARLAYLERSGDISVIPNRVEPKVVEIRVADGVQTVKLEIA